MSVVPGARFELAKAQLLRLVGVPISIATRACVWCGALDSNQEKSRFECDPSTNCSSAAASIWWSDEDSNLNGTSRPAGYSRVPYRIGVRSVERSISSESLA